MSLLTARAWSASVLRPSLGGDQSGAGQEMVVVGGVGPGNVTLDTVELVSINDRGMVSTLSQVRLPTPLAGHCAVQLNSTHTFIAGIVDTLSGYHLLTIISGGSPSGLGGLSGTSINITNQAWLLTASQVLPVESMREARTGHSCTTRVSLSGGVEVVVVGGVGVSLSGSGVRRVLDTVEIWSSETGHWRQGVSLARPMFGASMLELSGQPVLIGQHTHTHSPYHEITGHWYVFRGKV